MGSGVCLRIFEALLGELDVAHLTPHTNIRILWLAKCVEFDALSMDNDNRVRGTCCRLCTT